MKRNSILFLLLFALTTIVEAQSIPRMSSVKVTEGNRILRNPDAGGLNVPEYSPIDLDGDGIQDLFVYDRSGKRILTFLNRGTANQVDYDYAPEYISHFPAGITDFALCADYDCDGKADLFFGTNAGIKVYRNTSSQGNLSFQLYRDTLFTDYGSGPALIYLYQGDIPALVDIDSDGDLDLLAFNPGGTVIEWHKNMIMETVGTCAGLTFEIGDRCWGAVQESGLNQALTLGVSCRTSNSSPIPVRPSAHSGSTIAAFDEDADGDYELVIGDLLYDGLTYTHNSGSNVSAYVDSIDINFPSYDASVRLDVFPAAYFLDADNDGKDDMLTAPNGTNVSVNYDNSWFYKNVATGPGVLLSREKKNFLTEDMIDVGSGAYPAFFDYNSDGLMDIVVGNYSRKLTASNFSSSLTLYANTGTATAPEFTLIDRNYANIPNLLTNAPLGLKPTFGDMDGDGDEDMILGDIAGNLHYLENTAPIGQVASFPSAIQNYFGIDVGQSSAPTIADIDRDGKLDLVVGEIMGNLKYYHNTGTASAANFSATPDDTHWGAVDVQAQCCTGYSVPFIFTNPETGQYDLLAGSMEGEILYFKGFEAELGDTFLLDQANFGNIIEGGRTSIIGRDLTGDGRWEWVVGNLRGGLAFYSGNGIMTSMGQQNLGHSFQWEAFPNPSTGQLTFRMAKPATGEMHVSLTDIQGKTILENIVASAATSKTLNLSQLSPGIYFMRLDLNGQFCGVKRIEIMH